MNDIETDNIDATHQDAPISADTRTEDQMLGDLLRTSDFTKDMFADEALPEGQSEIPTPEGTDEDGQVPAVDDEVVDQPDQEELTNEDDTSTQDSVYALEDLDDFSVIVKIDGEEVPVSIQDLIKGYSTDKHLSQKGRELGDARKQLENERASKIGEIDSVMSAANNILKQSEDRLAKEFHGIDAEIKQAREDGDSYSVGELKDKKEVAQEKYWAARNEREAMVKQAETQKQQVENERLNAQMQTFGKEVANVIPDWSDEVATSIRDFALERGIPAEYIPQMADVNIIKFIDDFRRSEQSRSKGAVKRQAAPAKATPTRQQPPRRVKEQQAINVNKNKVLSGQGSAADNDAFLKNLAARHF